MFKRAELLAAYITLSAHTAGWKSPADVILIVPIFVYHLAANLTASPMLFFVVLPLVRRMML
jgi:hypothetical protein